jgi:hypothetical protein
MHPQSVACLKIGHLSDRQSQSGALHPNVNLGTDEIKGSAVSVGCAGKSEKEANKNYEQKEDRMRCLAAPSRMQEGISQGIILTDLQGRSEPRRAFTEAQILYAQSFPVHRFGSETSVFTD